MADITAQVTCWNTLAHEDGLWTLGACLWRRGLRGRSTEVSGVMLLLSAAPWPSMGGVPPLVGDRADTGDWLLSAERVPLACGGDMLEESDVAGDSLLLAVRPLLGEGEGLQEHAGLTRDRLELLAARLPLLGEGVRLQEHVGKTREWLGLLAARLPLLGDGNWLCE